MDAKQVKAAVSTIVTALAELQDLRWHRTGKLSADDLRAELAAMNNGAALGNGLLLRQKAQWFNYDSVRKELGNLKTIMETLARCLDEDVRREIDAEGYSLGKTIQPINVTLQFIEEMRAALNRHELLQNKISQGQPVDAREIASLETQLVELTDFEEQVAPLDEIAMQRVTQSSQYRSADKQPRSTLQRLAAAVVLPVAAAAAMFFGMSGTAYAQETAKAPQASAQQQSIDNQITALEAKSNKTADDYLTLTQLYTKADRLDKANDTIKAYLATNPNDIRGLVAKRDLDGKKGIAYKKPDDNLFKILNAFNADEYRKLIGDKKFKEIVNNLEQLLSTITAYDTTELNDVHKESFGDILNAIGSAYSALGRADEAIAACKLDIAITPNSPGSYSIIGTKLWERKQYDEAMKAFENTIKYAPNRSVGYGGMASCHFAKENYEKAMEYYQIALSKAETARHKEIYQKRISDCKEKLGTK
jgi:tetratricopeptide (TPR) repeat protein